MPLDFLLSSNTLANGKMAYYASQAGVPNSKFTIGYRVNYQNYVGLSNMQKTPVYEPDNFAARHGFWAYFIYPTAKAESNGSYTCLNTYDRARFTFSFMQYAAHVPNGDFVKFFKKLLSLPLASEYFPKLVLRNNQIFYKNSNGTLTQLEDNNSTAGLMDYLNPTLNEIENQELICSARMIHWATNDPVHIDIQVDTAIEHFKANMLEYNLRFNLHGKPDYLCQVICDIRHQGRSSNDRIAAAMNTGGNYQRAYQNLLAIGSEAYASRVSTIRSMINNLVNNGIFNKTYDQVTNSFV